MDLVLPTAVGLGFAIGVFLLGRAAGFDRDRSYYPVVLIVIALYYDLFAVMGGSARALVLEALAGGVFLLLAVLGFKRSLWFAAAGLVAHGVFDFIHGRLIANPGVPSWWPPFCASFDISAGLLLGWLQRRDPR